MQLPKQFKLSFLPEFRIKMVLTCGARCTGTCIKIQKYVSLGRNLSLMIYMFIGMKMIPLDSNLKVISYDHHDFVVVCYHS